MAREATTADFPVTITAGNGKVTIRKQPKRVISLSPTATESLFAIGAGKQVIAVDDQSDYPKTAPKTSLSGFTPNVEAIAAFEPDLVVVSYDPKGLVDALERLDIPVILHDAARSFPGAYQQIRQLGLVTGQRQGATKVIARMKTQIARVVRSVEGQGGRPHRLPRADAGLLLGFVALVRRQDLHASRAREHRRQGRLEPHRLPTAVGRVHRRVEP